MFVLLMFVLNNVCFNHALVKGGSKIPKQKFPVQVKYKTSCRFQRTYGATRQCDKFQPSGTRQTRPANVFENNNACVLKALTQSEPPLSVNAVFE